jgi:hypothetical protein
MNEAPTGCPRIGCAAAILAGVRGVRGGFPGLWVWWCLCDGYAVPPGGLELAEPVLMPEIHGGVAVPSAEARESLPIYDGVVDELGDVPGDVAATAEIVLRQAHEAVNGHGPRFPAPAPQ